MKPYDVTQMYRLAEHYSRASELLEEQSRGSSYGCSAPQLLVDSFAVEIYLKCLIVLDDPNAEPHGHIWTKLFAQLRPQIQVLVRQAFDRIIDDDHVLRNLPVINSDAPAGITNFDESLKVGADTFGGRRYLYEGGTRSDFYYADLVRKAIRNVTKLDLRLSSISIEGEEVS